MSKELYPLKFTPILKEKIWGGTKLQKILNKAGNNSTNIGESWEISGVPENVSVVENGFLRGNSLTELIEVYMGDLVGDSVYNRFGIEFPLLIKFIDAQDDLSVQVHPNDDVAAERHNSFGKTEMWYVIDAENDAELINGFINDSNKNEYVSALQNGKLSEILNSEKVKAGDVFFIPAGRIHAIGKGIVVAEIQQTSDITYRIYDWGRVDSNGNGRELHTDLAVDVINYKAEKNYKSNYKVEDNNTVDLAECQYFKTNLLSLKGTVEKDYNAIDSFVIYMCIEGEFYIHNENGLVCKISKGETVLIPATMKSMELKSDRATTILEVYLP